MWNRPTSYAVPIGLAIGAATDTLADGALEAETAADARALAEGATVVVGALASTRLRAALSCFEHESSNSASAIPFSILSI